MVDQVETDPWSCNICSAEPIDVKGPSLSTFGRESEKSRAVEYVRDPAERPFVETLIDAIHDVLDGTGDIALVRPLLERGFAEGGAGVWEQCGVWLRKLSAEHPALLDLWQQLSRHRSAVVRFRLAAHLSDMPATLASELGEQLLADRSAKVREKAAADLAHVRIDGISRLLRRALEAETHTTVSESIRWALDERVQTIPEDRS
jgi:hypothetical protein